MSLPNESLGYDIEKSNQLVKLFASPADYAEWLEHIPIECYPPRSSQQQCVINTIKGLRNGNMHAAHEAEKIISQLEDEEIFADGAPKLEAAIVGGFTVTQLYNQGIPTCMLTHDKSHLKGFNTPLTIYFDAYGSIGLGAELAMKRGVACLAFAMAMSRIRPIDMYVITCSSPEYRDNSLFGALVKVPTDPLDLARVGFMMTDYDGYISFARWVAMSWNYCRKHPQLQKCYRSAVGPFGGSKSKEAIKHAYKTALDAKPDDIVLYGTQTTAPRIHNEDAAKDPIGWVRAMLKLHRDRSENETEATD